MNIIGSYWNLRWRSLVRKGFAQGRPSRRTAGTSACQTDRQGWSCWRSTCLSGIPSRRGRSGAGTGAARRQQRKHSIRKAAQGCLP